MSMKDDDDEEEDYNDELEQDDDDNGDFDANELLNLTDYQNKRKQTNQQSSMGSSQANPLTKVGKDGAIEISNDYYEEDDDNAWGEDWGAVPEKQDDLDNFDYSNTNLNKLSQAQIEKHKKNMDKNFSKNQLKPGDPGFQYDKRIEFNKKAPEQQEEEDSWDEGVDDYFDDDY